MSETKIILTGNSGRKYNYSYYPIGTEFKSVSGNYVFIKIYGDKYEVIYIGKTNDLSERFDNHHKMPDIKRAGATHICVHTNSTEASRTEEESDLLVNYRTPCNEKQNMW
jgi:hypothetical protein